MIFYVIIMITRTSLISNMNRLFPDKFALKLKLGLNTLFNTSKSKKKFSTYLKILKLLILVKFNLFYKFIFYIVI